MKLSNPQQRFLCEYLSFLTYALPNKELNEFVDQATELEISVPVTPSDRNIAQHLYSAGLLDYLEVTSDKYNLPSVSMKFSRLGVKTMISLAQQKCQ